MTPNQEGMSQCDHLLVTQQSSDIAVTQAGSVTAAMNDNQRAPVTRVAWHKDTHNSFCVMCKIANNPKGCHYQET